MRPRGGTCRSSEGFRTGPAESYSTSLRPSGWHTRPAAAGWQLRAGVFRRARWVPDRPVTDPTAQGRWAGRGAGC